MADRSDPECSRNLLEGKQNNLARANNGLAKADNSKLMEVQEEADRLRTRLDALQRWLYWLAIAVVIGTVILIIVVAVLYGKLNHDLTHHSHKPKVGAQLAKILEREKLCLPCDSIRLGPSPEEDDMLKAFTRMDNEEGEQCCVETPTQLLDLLGLYIERRYREEMARGNIKINQGSGNPEVSQSVAAHLMGSLQRLDANQAPGRQFPVGQWIYDEDLAFTSHVAYRHGRIVVPADGIYFVYSHVSYLEVFDVNNRDSSTRPVTGESPSLSHYMYRYNVIYPNGGEEKLIQNSITKCWGPNKAFGEYSSYLGAVFHLRKGDEIFVKVSNLTMLARDPKSNYFGLFKI